MTNANHFQAALDHELEGIVNDPTFPLVSLSVAAIRDGRVVYESAFGARQLAPTRIAATPDSLYRIASISKLITTLGAMKLVESGKLNLDEDISVYLGYALRNPHFPSVAITTRMLMSHTSSLRDDAGYYFDSAIALREVLVPGGSRFDKGAMWSKNAAPGQFFQYANLPWGVLATVMERVSGVRFDRWMTQSIFSPLSIEGGFHPADFAPQVLQRVATLYRKRDEKEVWDSKGPWRAQVDDYTKLSPVPRAGAAYVAGHNGTAMSPQGGARLSARGLATLMQMLMQGGEVGGVRVLRADTVAEMLRTQWQGATQAGDRDYGVSKDYFNAWGLGNQHFLDIHGNGRGDRLVEPGGFKAKGHFGDAYGLTSAFVFDPVTRNGIVFMTGGCGVDPDTSPGKYSAMARYEERILTALHRHALS